MMSRMVRRNPPSRTLLWRVHLKSEKVRPKDDIRTILLYCVNLRIYTIWQTLAFQTRQQILCRHPGHFFAGGPAAAGDMRCKDHFLRGQWGAIHGEGFGPGHTEPRRENPAFFQGVI